MTTTAATEDFDEEDCLCQAKVPKDKRMDFIQRIFDEKTEQWKWKTVLRYHKDCSIHGVKVIDDAARAEPTSM